MCMVGRMSINVKLVPVVVVTARLKDPHAYTHVSADSRQSRDGVFAWHRGHGITSCNDSSGSSVTYVVLTTD